MKLFAIIFTILLTTATGSSQSDRVKTALARIDKATAVMKTFADMGENNLPIELARKAKAIAIFPEVGQKATFLSRNSKGRGIFVRRNASGSWGTPTYLRIRAMRPEFTRTLFWKKDQVDIVFLIVDDKGFEFIEGFRSQGFFENPKVIREKLGLGPLVKGKGTDEILEKAWVIYYTFQDAKLSGIEFHNNKFSSSTLIQQDDDNNRAIYKRSFQDMLKLGIPSDGLSVELTGFQKFMNDNFKEDK